MYCCACLLLILISCSSPQPEVLESAARDHDSLTVATVVDTNESRVPVEREQVTIERKDENGRGFKFSAARMPFDPKRHDISRLSEDCQIDGERMYGTDCDPPRYEFKEMTLEIDGRTVAIPRTAYQQFYEPSLGYDDGTAYPDAHISPDRQAVFVLMNGDDAGAYSVIWSFRQDRKHSKMVTHDEVYFRFINGPE